MTITREQYNLGVLEDAVASIGEAINATEDLRDRLARVLPDGFALGVFDAALERMAATHDVLTDVVQAP